MKHLKDKIIAFVIVLLVSLCLIEFGRYEQSRETHPEHYNLMYTD